MTNLAKNFSIFLLTVVVLTSAFVPTENAQGSRKDDVVFNAQRRPMAGATVRICTSAATGQPCTPLAAVYSDAGLTQALANPLLADGLGNYTFYATPGRYEIEISGPGITTKQLPNVILPSDPSTPTFTTVTTTSGISAFSLSLTGNLTVSGSTSVTGTLSVGGAPVPSTVADNQWVGNQRFGGPIPWRDFTKYMPAGGCSSLLTGDPIAVGNIMSGTNSLALSTAADFKNGCGIAVTGAGPTATVTMAGQIAGSAQICSNPPACTSHTGTLVSFSQTSGTIPLIVGAGDGSNPAGVIAVSGCSNSTLNVTTQGWIENFGNPINEVLYNDAAASGGRGTGCTATFYAGWPHGITGSTTYKYYAAPIDLHGGLGPAVGPITITNGNATLSAANGNYNFLSFNGAPGIKGYAIWSDKGLGGAQSCIQVAYTTGYADYGLYMASGCPSYIPATPPSVATPEVLNTTIVSGGGTTSLTLAANASNTATVQAVHDDVTMFLTSCINDVIADQAQANTIGSHGCVVPYGRWPFYDDMPTDTVAVGFAFGVNLFVEGTAVFDGWPWIIGSGYQVYGLAGDSPGGNGLSFPATYVERGEFSPAGAVIHGSKITLSGFNFANEQGNALEITNAPNGTSVTSSITLHNLDLNVQDTIGTGVPLLIDTNVLYVQAENLNLVPSSTGFPASILFTGRGYCGNGQTSISIRNMFTQWYHIAVDAPGGQYGSGTAFAIFGNWQSELHGPLAGAGIGSIYLDTGTGTAPGGCADSARVGAYIEGLENADATENVLLYMTGNNSNGAGDSAASVTTGSSASFGPPLVLCTITSTVCSGNGSSVGVIINSPGGTNYLNGQRADYLGSTARDDAYYVDKSFKTGGGSGGGLNHFYPTCEWCNSVPPIGTLSVVNTGSGGLAAGTYCMTVTVTDFEATPGETVPGTEICQTVGASSSINLSWAIANGGYGYPFINAHHLWFGTAGPGSENQYLSVSPSVTAGVYSYTFTSTSGATGGAPPSEPTAYDTYFYRDYGVSSCILCVNPAYTTHYQLGVGEPTPAVGDKLAVKGGVLDVESGFKSTLVTKSSNYTLTTSDYWVNATGTTTITVPHANVGNRWVVFNSGSSTVTLQADTGNINGAASITLSANTGKEIACDGTNCFAH